MRLWMGRIPMHPASPNQPLRGKKMTHIGTTMFYEDLAIALFYFIGFGSMLVLGGGIEMLVNKVNQKLRGRDDQL